MGKNTAKTLVIVAAVLVVGIFIGILLLFRSHGGSVPKTDDSVFVAEAPVYRDLKGIGGLLQHIPTDAIAVCLVGDAADGIPCPFGVGREYSGLDLGAFKGCRALVSLHYLGSMSSLLVLDLGRSDRDFQSRVDKLECEIAGLGLDYKYYPPSDDKASRGVMTISRSSNVLASSQLHRDRGASLSDVDGFDRVMETLPSKKESIVLDTRYLGRLLDRSILSDRFSGKSRNEAFGFIASCAQWIIATPGDAPGLYAIEALYPEDGTSFLPVIGCLQQPESLIGSVLPADADYVVSLALPSVSVYLPPLEGYLDANGRLVSFSVKCIDFKRRVKVSPVSLLESLGVKEVAKIGCAGADMLSLRVGKNVRDISEYRPEDIVEAVCILFGKEFGISGALKAEFREGFLLLGSEIPEPPASGETFRSELLQGRGVRMFIHTSIADLCWYKNGMELKIN